MCKLCRFAASSKEYGEVVEKTVSEDLWRILETKKKKPGNTSVFTNLKDWMSFRPNFALFEPLAAFPNPNNYYQSMEVDGEKLGLDWQSGWTRSLAFTPDGKVLLWAKATDCAAFKPDEKWFRYLFLVKFEPSDLEIVCEPPRFIIRADKVKVSGTNLLTYLPAEHVFSFTFSHLATERASMKADAASQSTFYKELIKRGATKEKAPGTEQKSDFEKYLVTTLHFVPPPQMMLLSKQAGYDSRFEFQTAVPEFLNEHFGALAPMGKKPAQKGGTENV